MAYYDEPLVDPTQDFDAQQLALTQQAARIKALRDRYAKPYTPDNQEVGGYTLSQQTAGAGAQRISGRAVPQTWGTIASAAAPFLADYTAGQQEKAMAGEQSALNQRIQADALQQAQDFPQPTTKQTPLGPDQPTGSFVGSPEKIIAAINNIADPVERDRARQAYTNQQSGNMKTETVQPERSTVLAKATAMMNNPLLRATAQQKLADQLIKDPERDEARAERAAKAASDLAEARRKQGEDLEYKRWQQQQHNETLRAIAEGNQAARREAASASKSATEGTFVIVPDALSTNGLPVERNNKTGETREVRPPEGTNFQGKPKEPKPLSEPQQKAQDSLLTDSRTYGSAFSNYKPDYAGRGGSGKADVLAGQYLPFWSDDTKRFWEPINARIAAENHNIYGANFTGIEQSRANAYQPGAGNSDESNLRNLGQRAIDSSVAQLRSQYLHKHAGSYMDNDGRIVLPDGRVINETASREISDAELKTQRLKPTPTFRDLDAGAAKPARVGQPAVPANRSSIRDDVIRTQPGSKPPEEPTYSVVRSKEERDALAPGTVYIDAQGNKATKK